MRSEYVSADEEQQKELKAKYDKLVEEATALQPKLTESAEKAYAENPKADPQIEKFMKAYCIDNFMIENFEECYRVANLLLAQGVDDESINLIGGAAAFCTNHLDEAEKLLKKATEDDAKPIGTAPNKRYLDMTLNDFIAAPAKYKKAWAKEQEIRAKEAKANDLPRVLLKTSVGDIVIELFENEAPLSVANFVSLVDKGFYDGLTFHRVLESFMAQGGCPRGDGTGGPGYKIPCECYEKDYRKHFRGSLSMAHAGKDTGGSQFFLTFLPTTSLDGKHTVFGRVVEGMDTVSKIKKRDPDNPKGAPDKIIKATVVRKRDHKYEPKKVGE